MHLNHCLDSSVKISQLKMYEKLLNILKCCLQSSEDTHRTQSPLRIQLLKLSTMKGCTNMAVNANGLPTAIPQ